MTTLFSALLKASFQGSVVILAVLVLRLLLKNAPKSALCMLWLLAGLRLMLPFEIQSPLSLQPRLEESPIYVQADDPVAIDPIIPNQAGQALETPPAQTPTMPNNLQTQSYIYHVEDGVITGPLTFTDVAIPIWLLGMGILILSGAFSYLRLKRRVREACLTDKGYYECPGLDTAFVLGFFPARIYLPTGLSREQTQFICDHEKTHIARNDHWCKLLGYLVLCLHWFNPLVWVAYSLLCRDMELACDEHVVKYMSLDERKAYSAALLSCAGHNSRIAACPVAFGESNPKKRILNVLHYKRPGFWISLAAVIALIFVAVCLLTSPDDGKENRKVEGNSEAWYQEIEQTLYDLQLPDNYAIVEQRFFGGSAAPMESHERNIFVYGDDRFQVDHEKGSGIYQGVLVLNGSCFTAEAPETSFIWEPSDDQNAAANSWLHSFDLKNSDAQAISRMETQEGHTIRLLVHEPYQSRWIEVEEYFVDFFYDQEGNFRRAELYAETMDLSMTLHMSPSALAGYSISSTIEQYANPGISQALSGVWEGEAQQTSLGTDAPPETVHAVLTLCSDGTGSLEYLRNGELWENFNSTFTYAPEGDKLTLNYDQGYSESIPFRLTGNELYLGDYYDLTLTRTGFAPSRPSQIERPTELEKCRLALEGYQARGSWCISMDNRFSGRDALNTSSTAQWYGCGSDYLTWCRIPEDGGSGCWWDLCVDGASHHRTGFDGHHASDTWDSGWEEGSNNNHTFTPPWPLSFRWEENDIAFAEAGYDGTYEYITCTVQGSPYGTDTDSIRKYQVTFCFRPDGELYSLELQYNQEGADHHAKRIFLLESADEAEIRSIIDQARVECDIEHHQDEHHH